MVSREVINQGLINLKLLPFGLNIEFHFWVDPEGIRCKLTYLSNAWTHFELFISINNRERERDKIPGLENIIVTRVVSTHTPRVIFFQ